MPRTSPLPSRVVCALLLTLPVALAAVACAGDGPELAGDVEVEVGGVGLDPMTDSPVVVLRELEGVRELPIWIGPAEARSIAIHLEHVELPRPNTHDLARRLLGHLEADVDRVVVTRLSKGTYYAILVLQREGRRLEVDSRPSDAIAIALRAGAPLFVREGLFASGGDVEEAPESGERLEL